MSVPAEDELSRQSLEQSLCPNEEDSTDSTSAPAQPPACPPTPASRPGFHILKCRPTEGTNDSAPYQGKW